tara:strand:+ start:19 stop:444 length:426 start_codon:yes stop_codon:yes gene_type:complete
MATRSRIGLQLADGNILSVYHHWDGYPQWLGVTLNNKFNTREKVAELIDGGDISCCDSDSDWNLNKVENHVQYYNDRGDNTSPRLDSNFDDYVKNGEEYAYVFTLDHVWECYAIDRNYDEDYNVTGVNVKAETIPTEEAVA